VEQLLNAILSLPSLSISDLLLTVLEVSLGRSTSRGGGALLSDGGVDLFRFRSRVRGRKRWERGRRKGKVKVKGGRRGRTSANEALSSDRLSSFNWSACLYEQLHRCIELWQYSMQAGRRRRR